MRRTSFTRTSRSHNFVYDRGLRPLQAHRLRHRNAAASEENKFQAPAALEGTLAYIAPEQTGRMNRSARLSRRPVLARRDAVRAIHRRACRTKAPTRSRWCTSTSRASRCRRASRASGVPEAVSNIVMKLLQKEPENRYQSAAGLAADLRRLPRGAAAKVAPLETFALGTQDADRSLRATAEALRPHGRAHRCCCTSFERVARGGVETDHGRGSSRHRQDVARARNPSADHAPARLLRRGQVRPAAAERAVQRDRERAAGPRAAALDGERGSDRPVADARFKRPCSRTASSSSTWCPRSS